MKKLTFKQVEQKIKKLKTDRGTWESHWQEITDHVLPRKNTITTTRTEGEKRTWQLLDNTGVNANEMLAGALHGLLTNPDLPWFEYTTGDLALDANDEVRAWLQKAARVTHNVLNNSNFQTEVHELYLDLPSIGTSCMFIEEDSKYIVRFSTKFIVDYFIEENHLGYVDQVYREWKWTPAQIIAEFGKDKVPKKVIEAFNKGLEDKFCIYHALYPVYLVEPEDKNKLDYISQYFIEADEDGFEVSVGKYNECPYVVPRWSKAAGEKYGRSPAMTALPELKVLNKMNETMLIGAQKQVDPPLQLPDDGMILPIITKPGGINYYRAGSQDRIEPVFNDTRLDFGYQAMEDRRKRVKDSFYVDQLKLQQGGPMMTATEVLQRTEEAMRLLGPMLGRMQSEFLRPLIDRVFRIVWDRGLIPPPPPELEGRKVDVRYSSLIAKSQRVNEAQSIVRLIQTAAPFMQIDPAVADNFNGDAAVRILADTYGAPVEVLNNSKAVAQNRSAKAQMQQQALAAQQQQNTVDNALTMAKTAKEAQGI